MTIRTVARVGLVVLTMFISGCSGGRDVANTVGPSPLPTAEVPPPVVPPPNPGPGVWLGGTYTLTAVSLYGLVYEETPAGRVGIAGAAVYCEVCGEATHTWAIADANGFYRFSGDLATGGGVWLRSGIPTVVGIEHDDYQDPPGVPLMFSQGGWRQVMVSGDTLFDIQLVRR